MDYTCMEYGLDHLDRRLAAAANERRLEFFPNQAVAVAAEPGTVVRGLRGRIWLTQEGHSRDYVLVPGMSYVSLDRGKIVLNSLDAASTASVGHIELAPGASPCTARLELDSTVVARIERDARRARAAEMGRWTTALGSALMRGWRSITARRDTSHG